MQEEVKIGGRSGSSETEDNLLRVQEQITGDHNNNHLDKEVNGKPLNLCVESL